MRKNLIDYDKNEIINIYTKYIDATGLKRKEIVAKLEIRLNDVGVRFSLDKFVNTFTARPEKPPLKEREWEYYFYFIEIFLKTEPAITASDAVALIYHSGTNLKCLFEARLLFNHREFDEAAKNYFPDLLFPVDNLLSHSKPTPSRIDMGDAPEIFRFFGRENYIKELESFVFELHSKLIGVFGFSGMGKTVFVTNFVEHIVMKHYPGKFNFIIWRSLKFCPTLKHLLLDILTVFQSEEGNYTITDTQYSVQELILILISNLEKYRSLIVLDNIETVLDPINNNDYECFKEYGLLLKSLSESRHKSCAIITSKMHLKEFKNTNIKTKSIMLSGLELEACKSKFLERSLFGTQQVWEQLVTTYKGNPKLLELISSTIEEIFEGSISDFLKSSMFLTSNLQDVLFEYFDGLTELDRLILYWLSISLEPMTLESLTKNIQGAFDASRIDIIQSIQVLRDRLLIDSSSKNFFLQSLMLEFTHSHLVKVISREILSEKPHFISFISIIDASSSDYIQHSQSNLLLHPILSKLKSNIPKKKELFTKLFQLINTEKNKDYVQSYTPGNVFSILKQIGFKFENSDLSNLVFMKVDFRGVPLHHVNLSNSKFIDCTFTEYFDRAMAVDINEYGTELVASSTDNNVYIWDLESYELKHTLRKHKFWVPSVKYSKDGRKIASGGYDSKIIIWDTNSGDQLYSLTAHTKQIWRVCFSPNGKLLATGGEDCTIHLWSTEKYEHVASLVAHRDSIYALCFSIDGSTLYSAGEECSIICWDLNEKKHTFFKSRAHNLRIRCLCVSSNNQFLASSGSDKIIKIWNLKTGELFCQFENINAIVREVIFSLDNTQLFSAADDGKIRVWNIKDKKLVSSLSLHTGWVRALAYNSQNNMLVSGGDDQIITLWDLVSNHSIKVLTGYSVQINSLSFHPNNHHIISGSNDGFLRIWDLPNSSCKILANQKTKRIYSVCYSKELDLIAAGDALGNIHLRKFNGVEDLRVLKSHSDRVKCLDFSSSKKYLATASDDRTINIWDLSKFEKLFTLSGHSHWVHTVVFGPEGKLLASGSEDMSVKIWDVTLGKCIHSLLGHKDTVWNVSFIHNTDLVVSADDSGEIIIWKLVNEKVKLRVKGHKQRITSICIGNEKWIYTCSDDGTLKMWDLNLNLINEFQFDAEYPQSCCISQNQRFVAVATEKGNLYTFDSNNLSSIKVIQNKRIYESLNIAGCSGLSDANRENLIALGAVI